MREWPLSTATACDFAGQEQRPLGLCRDQPAAAMQRCCPEGPRPLCSSRWLAQERSASDTLLQPPSNPGFQPASEAFRVPSSQEEPILGGSRAQGVWPEQDSSTTLFLHGPSLLAAQGTEQCPTGWGFPRRGGHRSHSLQSPHFSPHTPEGLTHPSSF